MTSISHRTSYQPSYQPPFHYVEVHLSPTIVSSSSSLLSSTSSTSSSSSDNEKRGKQQQRRKKKNPRNTMYLHSLKLPDFPVKTQCPNCNKFVETHIKYQNGTCVYVFAMGLFVLTVALFWVPFFVDSCKDVTHFCPDCKCDLGTRRRI